MATKKIRTSFALSKTALELLKAYAEVTGISQASSLELFIREKTVPALATTLNQSIPARNMAAA